MGEVVTLRPWTKKEIDFLYEAHEDRGWSIQDICEKLDRTKNMVIGSANRHGLRRPELISIGKGQDELFRLGKCSQCEIPIFSDNAEDWTDPLICVHCSAGTPDE